MDYCYGTHYGYGHFIQHSLHLMSPMMRLRLHIRFVQWLKPRDKVGACMIREGFLQFRLRLVISYPNMLLRFYLDENSNSWSSDHIIMTAVLMTPERQQLFPQHSLQRHTPTLQHPNLQWLSSSQPRQNFCTNLWSFRIKGRFPWLSLTPQHCLRQPPAITGVMFNEMMIIFCCWMMIITFLLLT